MSLKLNSYECSIIQDLVHEQNLEDEQKKTGQETNQPPSCPECTPPTQTNPAEAVEAKRAAPEGIPPSASKKTLLLQFPYWEEPQYEELLSQQSVVLLPRTFRTFKCVDKIQQCTFNVSCPDLDLLTLKTHLAQRGVGLMIQHPNPDRDLILDCERRDDAHASIKLFDHLAIRGERDEDILFLVDGMENLQRIQAWRREEMKILIEHMRLFYPTVVN